MRPFRRHTGVVAPLLIDNVDTDQIIPSREMTTVGKTGLGDGLFANWRYQADVPGGRTPDPGFVLNRDDCRDASILLSGRNFGCGSSREHAVWALVGYGIRAILAESFGKIFQANCARNGLLAIELSADDIAAIDAATSTDRGKNRLTIDVEALRLALPDGRAIDFSLDPYDRSMLLEGLDHIGLTLQHEAAIDAHTQRDRVNRPWAYR